MAGIDSVLASLDKAKGGSPAKTTSSLPVPKSMSSDPMAKLNQTWSKRAAALQAAGYDFNKHIAPVISSDKARVRAGGNAYGNQEAQQLVKALKTGKPPFTKSEHGHGGPLGFLGNAVSDVGSIAGGLINVPGAIAGDTSKLVHVLANTVEGKPGGLHWKGDQSFGQAWEDLSKAPLARMLPGVQTGEATFGNKGVGLGKQVGEHPVNTLLDVLPFASGAGKLLAGGTEVATEAGSINEALAAGKPLKAGARVIGKIPTGKLPLKSLKAGTTLSDEVTRFTHWMGSDKATTDYQRWGNIIKRQGPDVSKIPEAARYWDQLKAVRAQLSDIAGELKNRGIKEGDAIPEPFIKQMDTLKAREVRIQKQLGAYASAEYGMRILEHTKTGAEVASEMGQELSNGTLRSMFPTLPTTKLMEKGLDAKYVRLDRFLSKHGSSPLLKRGTKVMDRFIKEQMGKGFKTQDIYVPRYIDTALSHWQGKGWKMLDKPTDVFKYAVLTGPRHMVHIFTSNLVFSLLEQGPGVLREIPQAWRMARNPEEYIRDLAHGQGIWSDKFDFWRTDEIAAIAQGKTMGRMVKDAIAFLPRKSKMIEDLISDTSRASVYLFEHDKALSTGMGEGQAHIAALDMVNKTLMDIDGMSPFERTVLKRVIPFYAFERQVIRYMLRYPSDHPIRAAILAQIGALEAKDQPLDLPWKTDNLFFLGSPDSKGNVDAIDMKNFNPFRSVAGQNPLTLAGFLSSLHPGIQLLLKATGTNVLTATPELFPQLAVDPQTGGYTVRRPGLAATALETFIPPMQSIDNIIGLSNTLKSFKDSAGDNGNVYRRILMSNLNLPFTYYSNYNVPKAKLAFDSKYYAVAKQDVRNATGGDASQLDQYSTVPFGNREVTTKQLTDMLNQVAKLQKTGG